MYQNVIIRPAKNCSQVFTAQLAISTGGDRISALPSVNAQI